MDPGRMAMMQSCVLMEVHPLLCTSAVDPQDVTSDLDLPMGRLLGNLGHTQYSQKNTGKGVWQARTAEPLRRLYRTMLL